MFFASIALAAAAVTVPSAGKQGAQALAQPGRDPALLHRGAEHLVETKEREQERALRSLLALGGSELEQAEVAGRLANLLRSRGLALAVRAAAEAEDDPAGAERRRTGALAARFLLTWRSGGAIGDALCDPRLERAVGVIYRPETERMSHYFQARLPQQFDAVPHFDETRAVEPLEYTSEWEAGEVRETFPFAV